MKTIDSQSELTWRKLELLLSFGVYDNELTVELTVKVTVIILSLCEQPYEIKSEMLLTYKWPVYTWIFHFCI